MGNSPGPDARRARSALPRRRSLLRAVGAGCAMGPVALARAVGVATPDAQASAAPGPRLDAELVRTGLYLIRGGGGNSLLRLSANGMILVDGKLPGTYRALMSQVRRISRLSDMSVRLLVLTNHHDDHAGDSAQFVAAGIAIVAQREALAHLSLPESQAAVGRAAVVAYDVERTLRMGGVEVQLKHFGPGRTSGDTVVYFPDLKIVALGDLFAAEAPEPDFAAGGSLVGWRGVLAQVLELDFDRVVPGSGPVASRDDLVTFAAKVDALASRAIALVKAGVAKNDLMSRLQTGDLGWQLHFSGPALDSFFAELSR
jgi:glyoxylase-like metal-dependent hydrolase (beta-lactamase superfamily II)